MLTISGNPLRSVEKDVVYFHYDGKEVTSARIIQFVNVCIEHIDSLLIVLDKNRDLDDYTQKVIGEKIINEIISIYELIKKIAEENNDYKNKEFKGFKKRFNRLNTKYCFYAIRNKVAAHKDIDEDWKTYARFWNNINKISIQEYYELIREHLSTVIYSYYPNEWNIYYRKLKLGFMSTSSNNKLYMTYSGVRE